MGYTWPVSLEHPDAGHWVGEQRSEFVDLSSVFEHLIHLPVEDGPPETEVWRQCLPDDAKFMRMLGPKTAHVRIKGGEITDVAIKLMMPKGGGLRRLADQVRHSRAQRRYLWAHRLRALGIDTPRPLGYLERAKLPALEKSFTASEYIFAPTLIEFRDQRVTAALEGHRDALLEKRALIRRVGGFLAHVHKQDHVPEGLRADDMLVAAHGIVLSGVKEPASPIARLTKVREMNLIRLARGFSERTWLTRTDRMRFLDAYLRHAAARLETRRHLFRRIGIEMSAAAELA